MDTTVFNPSYPPELPVCEHRAEILAALRTNQVVIVCGDTGSGKTTQLPKMAVECLGVRHKRVACTQPRRLAVVSMAERVAAELKCNVGGFVGFRHRFDRRISSDTRIEFMTDGVLLAETRFDPMLRAYDAIIVDEAHERSLNVDFLLGILKRILRQRPELKVIVSSATLNVEKFATYFDNAPTVIVPGRLFPVDIGYRPALEEDERDLPSQVAAAVAEMPARDDILVFLPGERDIRETADYLNDVRDGQDDIIPLLASLPASEQRRAFRLSPRRRIILATNVAETSVTIPGIRAVIDSGLARISRYVHRTHIQRLQVEPISQASAKQRAGRCGRLGPGVCLRLYSEEDYLARDAYTPPEILRSSLAGVILTMLDLGLGDIDRFPFVDPPKPTMVREGLRELLELDAIRHVSTSEDGKRRVALTDVGRKLARIPVEPRLARMLIAASGNGILSSVLPLVAAQACDDPRRRPIDEKARADQAQAKFRVPGSDFLGTLRLWKWWETETHELSQSKARKLCKATYLSYVKMREWRDLTHQLETLARRLGLSFAEFHSTARNQTDRDAEFSAVLHRSLLSGLLGRIGKYDEEERQYRGANGLRFSLHPSSVLAKSSRRNGRGEKCESWIMAGELVDTSALFARNVAAIDVNWLEPVAGAICKHSYHSPEWDEHSGFVRATEQVTLYGLVIVPARRCDYSRIDPVVSREIFIRRGLIDGDFPQPPPPVRANQKLIQSLRRLAERTRHPESFDEERLFAHFAKIVPQDICSANALRKWLRVATSDETAAFALKAADWRPAKGVADRAFPDSLRIADVTIGLVYRHTPDDPENDGVTCTVRRSDAAVLRLWRSDWLVPGLLPEKLSWMLGTLPTSLRRLLTPINESVEILLPLLKPGATSLESAVRAAVNERWGFHIPDGVWHWEKLPPHLQMRFRIRDDATGRTLALTRNLDEALGKASSSGDSSSAVLSRGGMEAPETSWAFGDIPPRQSDCNAGWTTVSYPALQDVGSGVRLRLFADAAKAAEAHASGVTRLFVLALAKSVAVPFRRNHIGLDAALYLRDIDYGDDGLAADMLFGAVRETLVSNRPEVRTHDEFVRRLAEDRSNVIRSQAEIRDILVDSTASATKILRLLDDERLPGKTVDSVSSQIAWLLFRGFPRVVPLTALRHYHRYLQGVRIRLERARNSPTADLAKEEKFAPHWERYREALRPPLSQSVNATALTTYRWMVEEYRISLFAQELHTPEPVSPKRLDRAWEDAVRDATSA